MTTTRNASKFFACGLILGLFLMFGTTSCEKRVTPKKVQRIIMKDSWRISNFFFEGQNIESSFEGRTLGFGEADELLPLPNTGIQGHWRTSTDKKPTILYMAAFYDSLFFSLNDDWTVTTCSKSTINLESESGSFLNKITLIRVETD